MEFSFEFNRLYSEKCGNITNPDFQVLKLDDDSSEGWQFYVTDSQRWIVLVYPSTKKASDHPLMRDIWDKIKVIRAQFKETKGMRSLFCFLTEKGELDAFEIAEFHVPQADII